MSISIGTNAMIAMRVTNGSITNRRYISYG